MRHLDPHELIAETVRRTRRRAWVNLALPLVPLAILIVVLGIQDRLPVELAFAGAIALGVALLYGSSVPAVPRTVASRIDRELLAPDHFLTLATVEERRSPLYPVVEAGAAAIGASASPSSFVSPIATRRIVGSALACALLFSILWAPALIGPSTKPLDRLERIAEELSARGNRELARELTAAIAILRDPQRSPEEKQAAAERALQKLDEESSGEGKGSGQQDSGESGEGSGEALRDEARRELEGMSGQSGESQSGEPEPGESSGGPEKSQGGGLEGPEPRGGAKEREGESTGNRPGPANGKSRDDSRTGGEGQGEDQTQAEAEGRSPQRNGGPGGEGGRPGTSEEGNPAERFSRSGEGWRIVDGRYVRVRIPEEAEPGEEVDRVQKPGRIEPATPFGNAPLPVAGQPGEVRDSQPIPLEYRDVLGTEGGRDR